MVGRSSWERRRSWASIASRWSRTGWKLSKLWWQAGHRGLKGHVHEDQQLASLIVELMGNPAALGLLGLQELAGEALQPLTGGLHFGIELSIGRWRPGPQRAVPTRWPPRRILDPTRHRC